MEFAEVASAARAVRELTDDKNWRSGLRVKHVLAAAAAGGGKEAKLAAAKEKATLKAAKLLEELQLQAEGAEEAAAGASSGGSSGAGEGGAPAKGGEGKVGKARQTREEVEALVAAGKLYATVRTQLCPKFSQVWMPQPHSMLSVTFANQSAVSRVQDCKGDGRKVAERCERGGRSALCVGRREPPAHTGTSASSRTARTSCVARTAARRRRRRGRRRRRWRRWWRRGSCPRPRARGCADTSRRYVLKKRWAGTSLAAARRRRQGPTGYQTNWVVWSDTMDMSYSPF